MTRSRAEKIGDAAIAILAEQGMRALTHRNVDKATGLPAGTTSNYARTRAALVKLALARMTERETAEIAALMPADPPATLEGYADLSARIIHHSITDARQRMLARYELAMEATRTPELRAEYDEAGRAYRESTPALLAAAGSPDPARHARMLVAWSEGVMFDTLAGAGGTHIPSVEELRTSVAELMATMIPAAPGRP